ncbi:hypothetical protein V5E97_08130 [Singulisphaera sp. Ch08]|uniref:Uncharacterized protein n=1 Tax=Singulisphaera sp. Ch08 TaxID=3120278 RepID=A0AAU7CM20_9BACT
MEPRFTRGEYWLLETVVEGGRPVLFLRSPWIEAIFNKPGHGMDRQSLVEALERLFRMGLIAASKLSEGDVPAPSAFG